jgi:hypothetical protein
VLAVCCDSIRERVATVQPLGLTKEQVTVFFPTDLMQIRLGEEIVVEVVGLFEKPECTHEVRQELAELVADVVRLTLASETEIPHLRRIEVLVHAFDQHVGGYQRLDIDQVH